MDFIGEIEIFFHVVRNFLKFNRMELFMMNTCIAKKEEK